MKKLIELEKSELEIITLAVKMDAHQFKQNMFLIDENGKACLSIAQSRMIESLPEEMREEAKKSLLERNSWQADAYQEKLEVLSKLENCNVFIQSKTN